MTPPLVDIGPNLAHDSFDGDREEVLERASKAGVASMIITGSDLRSTSAAIRIAEGKPDELRATAGVHPHHAASFRNEEIDSLRRLLMHPLVVAAGECGLDYFRNFSPPADQERAFRAQLGLAVELHKPVFLHQRDAHEPFVKILGDYLPKLAGGVAHCFTEDYGKARAYLDMGLYIGITGWICDERRGQALREAVRHLPLDRILIETDAPYLLPRTIRPAPASRRNEPAFLTYVLETLAQCRGESIESIASATRENSHRLFGFPA